MNIRIVTLLLLSLFFNVELVNGQAKKKKLPRNINMVGYNNFGPAVSGDGNSMVYMSNYTNDESTAMMFTRKLNAAKWKDPEELPRIINIPHLTYMNGYSLNFDGTEFYFTFKKSGGLGGYDIWRSERQGDGWGAAQNLGSPLNSSLNDGSPSISSDGKSLYFMSCESMTNNDASGCKLMVSTRSNTKSQWKKPTLLSDRINQGNALSPKILADGETLMYLSDHGGSVQWYISRMEEDEWQEPQLMDFIEENQQHNISVPARGRYVFHDVTVDRGSIIEQILIPENFKPKDVLRIVGTVNSAEGGILKVYNVDTRERKILETLKGGDTYDFVLKEGYVYDVSFETSNEQIPIVSELFDLMGIKFSKKQKWDVNPQPLNVGDSIELRVLKLNTTSFSVADESVYEWRRLTRFLSKDSEHKYDINIFHYPLDTATVVEIPMDSMIMDTTIVSDLSIDVEVDRVSIEMDSLIVMDSTIMELDTIKVEEEIIVPTLAENLATSLFQELLKKNISENKCNVNGITVPIKEFEENEALADKLVIYLKKRE